jgi:hypothetical protein
MLLMPRILLAKIVCQVETSRFSYAASLLWPYLSISELTPSSA